MIPRLYRFHGLGSLRYAYRNGLTVRSPLMAIKFAANDRRHQFRVAVVVSKKISKSAVVRNRIRRRIYNQINFYKDSIPKPYDIVITIFSEEVGGLPSDQLAGLLKNLLVEAKIVPASSSSKEKSMI